jgi:hypothetical protein
MCSEFEKNLKKAGVNDETAKKIINVSYEENDNEHQDNVNYCAAVVEKCNELLDFDVLAETMFYRSCCKGGFRLANSRKIAKEHSNKTLEEKLELLGQQKWMGHPHLTGNGEIYTEHCAGSDNLKCSCWRFNGCIPSNGKMPETYCLCCAGHFRFHYQKALGINLRVKKIVSSIFGEPPQYCSFLFEIVESKEKRKRDNNLPMGKETFSQLFDYLDRVLSENECSDTNSMTKDFLIKNGHENVEHMLEWFTKNGGVCDCEIMVIVDELLE